MIANPRLLWALLYVGINLAAFAIILGEGVLMGDLASFAAPPASDLAMTLLMVCGSILGLLGLHTMLTRTDFSGLKRAINFDRMGPYMTVLLLTFIFYVAETGLFIAGSTERGGSIVSALWVIFSVDSLFLVYYATSRESRGFKFNLLLWVISFLQRGWFGYLFFVIAMESFRLIRERRLFRWHFFSGLVVFIALYPFLDLLKVYVRVSQSLSVQEATNIIQSAYSASSGSWVESLQLAAEQIVGRVQVLSHAQIVADNLGYFQALSDNRLNPFWQEGVLGIILARFGGREPGTEGAQALAAFIAPNLDGSWNVNPSLVGWLGMHLDALPFSFIYVICLCVASAWLHQQLTRSEASFDRLWFIWLMMLIPGWIAQFVSVLVAQTIFLVVARFASRSFRTGTASPNLITSPRKEGSLR